MIINLSEKEGKFYLNGDRITESQYDSVIQLTDSEDIRYAVVYKLDTFAAPMVSLLSESKSWFIDFRGVVNVRS